MFSKPVMNPKHLKLIFSIFTNFTKTYYTAKNAIALKDISITFIRKIEVRYSAHSVQYNNSCFLYNKC